jgi:sterol desaturase/sphingolipid hydroxylase (fatty acid hydroxylase superfamily)
MIFLVGGLLLFWILEGAIPLIQLRYKKNKYRHAGINLFFTAIHLIIHTALAILIVMLSDWCNKESFGIFTGPVQIQFLRSLLGFLPWIFSSWLVHWVMHKVKPLWGFHLIHHTDNNVDVTTGLRHHPVIAFLEGSFSCC